MKNGLNILKNKMKAAAAVGTLSLVAVTNANATLVTDATTKLTSLESDAGTVAAGVLGVVAVVCLVSMIIMFMRRSK